MTEAPAPDACEDMTGVRAGVDAVDRALVALLARRQAYMEAAARIKTRREAVRDPARIETVMANVLQEAQAAGLSTAIAAPVWRVLIERSIAHELDQWDRLHGSGTA